MWFFDLFSAMWGALSPSDKTDPGTEEGPGITSDG